MDEERFVLTLGDVSSWAFDKFAKQEKAIRKLNHESSSFTFSLMLLGVSVCVVAYTIKKQRLMIDDLQAQIDELKPAGE
jgi:hypothetical protein